MEKKHAAKIRHKFPHAASSKKIICLDIPDEYKYMDEDLIEMLKSRVSEHIELPDN